MVVAMKNLSTLYHVHLIYILILTGGSENSFEDPQKFVHQS